MIPRTTYYLAGPMQGIPQFNFPLFDAVAIELRSHGHRVFNPADQDRERHGGFDISKSNYTGDIALAVKEHGFSLRQALAEDTQFIAQESTGICLLPGWEFSNGAMAEWFLARAIAKDPKLKHPFEFLYVHHLGDNLYSIPGIGAFDLEQVLA